MGRRFPIIHTLEHVHGGRKMTADKLARVIDAHPESIRRALRRLAAAGFLVGRKGSPRGRGGRFHRPPKIYSLTRRSRYMLDLLSLGDESRYSLSWREVLAVGAAVKPLARIGSLKPKVRPKVPAWMLNAKIAA